MKTRQGYLTNTSSMFTLAALVLGGAIVTTLVQAEETASVRPAPPSYLQPQLYRDTSVQPSQHRWLLPTGVRTSLQPGVYNVYFQDGENAGADQSHDEPDARMSFSVGDLRRSRTRDSHSRALMSDWERDQYRRNGALFSMSVGKRW